jgi:thioredoxin-like negative regulator of GroEL
MADIEGNVFVSVSERIAALKKQQGFHNPAQPPPRPAKKPAALSDASRRTVGARSSTVNTHPLKDDDVAVIKTFSSKTAVSPTRQSTAALKTPPTLPARPDSSATPPPLPNRKTSESTPVFMSRNLPQQQMSRKSSISSLVSHSSTMSSLSSTQTSSSTTPAPLIDTTRKFSSVRKSNVPCLPPRLTSRSNILDSPEERPGSELLTRPSQSSHEDNIPPPALPTRPKNAPQYIPAPAQTKSTPSTTRTSALTIGFNSESKPVETPTQIQRQRAQVAQKRNAPSTAPGVVDITTDNFDLFVMCGRAALIEFYGPRCYYCQQLEPTYIKLASNFDHARDRLIIGKADVESNPRFLRDYRITQYPTILLFDGYHKSPCHYSFNRELQDPVRQLGGIEKFLMDQTDLEPQRPALPELPAGVVEFTADNFDDYVLSGRAALIEFYGPQCYYCQQLEPTYKKLAEYFAHARSRLIIAKVNLGTEMVFARRFSITLFPTILLFDGQRDQPYRYNFQREQRDQMMQLSGLENFLRENTKLEPHHPVPPEPPAGVVELSANEFDGYLVSGCAILMEFYSTQCYYCQKLEPTYGELAFRFSKERNRLIIGKANLDVNEVFLHRYPITMFPTILFFDGFSYVPQQYNFDRELMDSSKQLGDLEKFLTQKMSFGAGMARPGSAVPPPINKATKPSFK